ncbi:YcaO-like family protein [Amycolatopsis pittospori]|uniref:YcaO-like family protein n=1 Tax=Amycolatopsis pittospori TaxID=2749434 RepID=UPI0015F10A5A|nr:YcaO-like family protein [Amycolatopsis pittospori]
MGSEDVRLRLDGVEITDLEPELCFLVTPNGGQFSITAPTREFRAWARRCDGTRTRAELLAGMSPDYAEVVEILEADGCLAQDDEVDQIPTTTILLTGSPALTERLAETLAVSGFASVETVPFFHDLSEVDTANTVVVAAFDHPAYAELTALDALCAGSAVRWLPLRRERGRFIAGPAITHGGIDFADVVARRRSAAQDPRVVDAFLSAPASGTSAKPGDTRWALANLAVHLERWLSGGRTAVTTGEIELNPADLTEIRRPILPVPDRARPVPAVTDPELLVDDQTGIVTGVGEIPPSPGMPARLKVCAVDVADMRRVTNWPNDRQAFGTSWHDFDLARQSAIGEAVERYCGSWLAPEREVRFGSYAQLARYGVPAVEPSRLNLYSAEQYRSPGFPFAPLTPDTECSWVEGFSHTTKESVWVPAFLISNERQAGEAHFADPLIAGLAGGTTEEHAVTSGLEEVLERDTTMLWWANTPRLARLPIPDEIRSLIADTVDGYEVTLIHLDNEFDVPVVAAAVLDRVTRWLSIGFAARPDALEAAKKALAEGFTLQHTCRALDNEHELSALRRDLPHLGNLKPYRADRRYLDSYREDFTDVADLLCQQQIYLDPRAGRWVAPWVRDLPERTWDDLPALGERRLKAYQDRVEARGFEVISVDLTTCDVAAAGFHAAHTLVPGLVSNFPAGLPLWGNGRIAEAAVRLGWRAKALAERDLNVFPLPHA